MITEPLRFASHCGRIRVTVPAPGALPVLSLTVDAVAMHPDDLAELVIATAEAAAETVAANAEPTGPGAVNEALQRMRAMRDRLAEDGPAAAMRHARGDLGIPDPPPPPGVPMPHPPGEPLAHKASGGGTANVRADGLATLDMALAVLESARAAATGYTPVGAYDEEVYGHAENDDRTVMVTASGESPLSGIRLAPSALRLGAEELSAEINRLIARAAEDLREQQNALLTGRDLPVDMVQAGQLPDKANAFAVRAAATSMRVHGEHEELLRTLSAVDGPGLLPRDDDERPEGDS